MRIFISYASEDRHQARRLHEYLGAIEELRPWLDSARLSPGSNWSAEVLRQIADSELFLFLCSHASATKATFVRQELAAALARADRLPASTPFIIPVRIDGSGLPAELQHVHAIDLSGDPAEGLTVLRKVVIDRLTRTLEDPFAHLQSAMSPEEREAWRSDYGEYVARYSASTVLRIIDERFTTYRDELNALKLLIETSRQHRAESLPAYVWRAHELGRRAYGFLGDAALAYGLFLEGSALLPDNLRTLELRGAFDSCLDFASSVANTFPACLLLVDVAKHYLAQRVSRYDSDWAVARKVIGPLSRYDLVLLDFAIFYARRARDCELLYDALALAAGQYPRNVIQNGRPERDTVNDPGTLRLNTDRVEPVRSFDRLSRKPALLLRAGACMVDGEQEEFRDYGNRLYAAGLELLAVTQGETADLIAALDEDGRRSFFDGLERCDAQALRDYAGAGVDRAAQLIEELISPLAYHHDDTSPGVRFASITEIAFHVQVRDEIRFLP